MFAAGQELTDPAHQQALERLRLARYRGKPAVGEDVELRDLSVYDRLAAYWAPSLSSLRTCSAR